MNENLNLVEILKDCPEGTKLYSTIYGEVEFDGVRNESEYSIKYVKYDGSTGSVTAQGLVLAYYDGDCTLFPAKNREIGLNSRLRRLSLTRRHCVRSRRYL